MKMKKVMLAAGARPNFMKIAAVMREMARYPHAFDPILVHTGQHYDIEMSDAFFNDLGLRKPDIHLGVGSGTHGEQTGKIMIRFEKVCAEQRPDLVIVVGDVNSTIACALVASKLHIPAAHVEAGLRSFDRTMPEEINRVLTDQVCDYLFTTCEDANQNLINEGIERERIHFVGNTMIDTLIRHIELARKSTILERLDLKDDRRTKKYAAVTLHRPSNVDHPDILRGILKALNALAEEIPVILPAHPRTTKQMKRFNLQGMVNHRERVSTSGSKARHRKILVLPPLGYLDFLSLMSNATLVLTDSGGIQEETTILGIPCLTLRKNTERPITVTEGTNTVVGSDPEKILSTALKALKQKAGKKKRPKYWDGKAAQRIVRILLDIL
ncbi:MAG: non-hydrolyzing UDP-N-acetylglucosamine 2-epimerase [Candidatus Aminicenantales bacterium]